MTYRIRNIAIAVALALVAALLVTFYVSNYKRRVQQGESSVQVYVAAHDIPAGATGASLVAQKLITPQDVTRRNVVPGAISNPDQIAKLVTTQPVYEGEQVTLRRFGTALQRGIRGQLKGTMRAFQVPGDDNQLLVGTLKAGDHVDVVANIPDGQSDHASRIVLRDIAVLRAADTGKNAQRATGSNAASVLLAVRDTQVQKLFFVLENAQWSLELRPPVDAADSPDVVETTNSVLNAGTRRVR